MNRREFIKAGAAGMVFTAGGGAFGQPAVEPRGPVRLKLGVLSDIHITDWAATGPFKDVLCAFDRWGADGVMVRGNPIMTKFSKMEKQA